MSEPPKDAGYEEKLTDGRRPGDFETRYPAGAWVQIIIELIYLVIVMGACASALFRIGYDVAPLTPQDAGSAAYWFEYPRDRTFLVWVALAIAGVAGGTAFALKFLYHSVAWHRWNRDRLLWRLIVPPLAGVVAVFVSFMIVSGLVPFLDQRAFDNFYVALGSGFFFGYFSDSVLASLKRLAGNVFGTTDKPR